MTPLLRPLAFLGRHATSLMAGGIFVGLVLPGLAAWLRPLLPYFVFLLAAATMIRIEWPEILAHVGRPRRLAFILVWGLVLSPIVTAALVARLGLPDGLAHAIVIWSASPALISSPAIAFLLGLDGSLALLVMVAGSFLMPLTLPPLVLGLLGVHLELGIAALMLRLVLFIGGAVALAAIARRLLGAARIVRLRHELGGFNVVLLVLFAIAIMDGVGDIALNRPRELLLYAASALAVAVLQQLLGTLAFLYQGRSAALTVGLVCGNRNMASVWASLGAFATPELTLFFIAVQLPIYILPAVLRPLYRYLLARPSVPGRVDGRGATQ
jgi:bile acid:Na+ symporter, BASS family